jgi:hypothetical protein
METVLLIISFGLHLFQEAQEFHAATRCESKANVKWGIKPRLEGGGEELFCKIMVILKAVLKQFGVKPWTQRVDSSSAAPHSLQMQMTYLG